MSSKKEVKRRAKEAKKKLKLEKKQEQERLKAEKKAQKNAKKGKGPPPEERPVVGKVIGSPTNFSHDTHVGWDADKGFEVRNIPGEWKKLFLAAGVKKEEIEDPETRKLLVDTVCASVYMMNSPVGGGGPPPPASGGPPPPPSDAGPPPPPSNSGPPLPSGGGPPPPTGMGGGPPKAVDPYAAGSPCEAKWAGDGQFYAAQIVSVREDNGTKYITVTFTEYGNTEEVGFDDVKVKQTTTTNGSNIGGGLFAGLSNAKQNLKSVDLNQMSEQQTEDIVGSLQKALKTRRAGMFYSVYQKKEDEEEEEENGEWDDDSGDDWMDF